MQATNMALDKFSMCSWIKNHKLLELKSNVQELRTETIQLKNMVKEMNQELEKMCFGTSVALKAVKQNQQSLQTQIDILTSTKLMNSRATNWRIRSKQPFPFVSTYTVNYEWLNNKPNLDSSLDI